MQQSPSANMINLTYLIYGLHLFSAINGVLTSAFVVTAFLSGWPSILAVILNYVQRDAVRGSYLESHFRWQIRTFWFALLWLLVGAALVVTIIGIPLAWVLVVLVGLWVLYRMLRGLARLMDRQPMPAE
tara:strand:+ start:6317 stop:6703 length:387 start_codon:yes stop_codon:yes gene_type:complete